MSVDSSLLVALGFAFNLSKYITPPVFSVFLNITLLTESTWGGC
jgi:hypothetical protein